MADNYAPPLKDVERMTGPNLTPFNEPLPEREAAADPSSEDVERAREAIRAALRAFSEMVGEKISFSDGALECFENSFAAALATERARGREEATDSHKDWASRLARQWADLDASEHEGDWHSFFVEVVAPALTAAERTGRAKGLEEAARWLSERTIWFAHDRLAAEAVDAIRSLIGEQK